MITIQIANYEGTWAEGDRIKFQDSVAYAIEEVGYRHIDTAYYYECEHDVGAALKKVFANGKVKREELFITTKVWPTFWSKPAESIKQSLEALGVDYVDLALCHWPIGLKDTEGNGRPFDPRDANGKPIYDPDFTMAKFWAGMEKVYESGKAKAIGVSNVSIPYMEDLLKTAKVVPAMNQVECHPYLPQQELIDYCHSKGIQVTAFSPFGGSPGAALLKDPFVNKLAEKYKCGPGNILINFQIQRDVCVIPKSFKSERLIANAQVVKLEDEDLKALVNLKGDKPHRFIKNDWSDFGFKDW